MSRRVRSMAKRIGRRTRYLFATPSALQGAARVFDAWGTYDRYNLSDEPEDDVAFGFVQDWLSLEDDVGAAFSRHGIGAGK